MKITLKICLTKVEMQEMERHAIEQIGIPSLVLMERAAMAVANVVMEQNNIDTKVWIFCGMGNNGADGIAVARILFLKKYHVIIIPVGKREKATEEYQLQEQIARKLGISFGTYEDCNPKASDCIIDGLFGIGLGREIQGEFKTVIKKIEEFPCKNLIAIDIPSGICATTGKMLGIALQASTTVTFGYEKTGLYRNEGRQYSGNIICADIGFPEQSVEALCNSAQRLEESDLENIPKRLDIANKGNYGRLLVIAGSTGMSGAAYLSAMAAYKTGAGLVKILTTEDNRNVLQIQLPEAIIATYTSENMVEIVDRECQWATTIVMGPGLGQADYVKTLVATVLEKTKVPMVLDADALNTIARNPELFDKLGEHIIMTPHMKEMSRLTHLSVDKLKGMNQWVSLHAENQVMQKKLAAEEIQDTVEYVKEFTKKHQVTCILKDATSIIVDATGKTFLTTSGNGALAKAGTGDVLAGIVGGLLCIGMNQLDAAAYSSFVHGMAGAKASQKYGKHSILARDVLDHICM